MKDSLLKKTRNRLTILYSGIMIFSFISFIMLSNFLLSSFLYHDQQQEVKALIAEEVEDHQEDLQKWSKNKKAYGEQEIKHKPNQKTFYYVVSSTDQLIHGEEIIRGLHRQIFKIIYGRIPVVDEVHFETVVQENGDKLYLAVAGRPVYNKEKYLGAVYAGIDVTSQKLVLEKLVKIFIFLSMLFIAVSSLLGYYMSGRAMVPINKSFERQREFVADASHEIRTPLTVLQSSLEVIEAEEGKRISAFSQQLLQDMKDEVKRLTKLAGDLLNLARADTGSIKIIKENFDLYPVVEQLARSLKPTVTKKSLNLHLDLPDQLVVVADCTRLTQLMYILLDNAIKYTPPGGEIFLSFKKTFEKIGKINEGKLQIIVEDTGLGIPLAEQEQIFNRFYRVDKGRSRDIGGTGLGLSIASWIVDVHGGTFTVDSTVGRGSKFTIFLPILATF